MIHCVEDGHEAEAARGGDSSCLRDGTDFIQSCSDALQHDGYVFGTRAGARTGDAVT